MIEIVRKEDGEVLASVPAATLVGAELAGAQLRAARLQEAALRGTDLSGADLQRADLRGADLREADLSGADLRGAKFRNPAVSFWLVVLGGLGAANLFLFALGEGAGAAAARHLGIGILCLVFAYLLWRDGRRLPEARLEGADLTGARCDHRTRWPTAFDPAAHGAERAGAGE